MHFEPATTNRNNIIKPLRYSFKKFLIIPKTTSTQIVDEMIGVDITELVTWNIENSKAKWEARTTRNDVQTTYRTRGINYLKGIPKEFCLILRQYYSICHQCKNSIKSEYHMWEVHRIDIGASCQVLWEMIKEFHDNQIEIQKKKKTIIKTKRVVFTKHWKPLLEKVNNFYREEYIKLKDK